MTQSEMNLVNEILSKVTIEDTESLVMNNRYLVICDGKVIDIRRENER